MQGALTYRPLQVISPCLEFLLRRTSCSPGYSSKRPSSTNQSGYCYPDRWPLKGQSTRVPINRISPAQREGKQRWLKDECWNEGLERCLTGGMHLWNKAYLYRRDSRRAEEQCKNLQVQKWRKSISTETRSYYTAGVKRDEDYKVLGRDKGTTYNRRANKVKVWRKQATQLEMGQCCI